MTHPSTQWWRAFVALLALISCLGLAAASARAQQLVLDLDTGAHEPVERPPLSLPANCQLEPEESVTMGTLGRLGLSGFWWVVAQGDVVVAGVRVDTSATASVATRTIAVSRDSGDLLWDHDERSYYGTSIADRVVLISGPEEVSLVETRSGRVLGRAPARHMLQTVCRNVGGRHYVLLHDALVQFDGATGAHLWTFEERPSAVVLVGARLVVLEPGPRHPQAVVLDPDTGAVIERHVLGELHMLPDFRIRGEALDDRRLRIDFSAWVEE